MTIQCLEDKQDETSTHLATHLQGWWQRRYTTQSVAEIKGETLANTLAEVETEVLVHAG